MDEKITGASKSIEIMSLRQEDDDKVCNVKVVSIQNDNSFQ